MQQLKEFKYSTCLDIKMVYYTIQVYLHRKDMFTVFTKFVKFGYNWYPIGM